MGSGERAGARTLNLLAAPLNARILRALRDGPKQQADLRRETGHPAQTTLRAQLKKLAGAGALEKQRRNRFPGVLEYELSAAGGNLLEVSDRLARWLEGSPEGELELGGSSAKSAVRALTAGWSATMLHALATGPLTLTELDGLISSLNYPSVGRRLAAMRLAGLVKAYADDGRRTPYGVATWARRAAAPLVAAIRWERRHAAAETEPIGEVEAETLLLLSAPLLAASERVAGACRLAMEIAADGERRLAGATVEIEDGRVHSYTSRLQTATDAWALGSPGAWLDAMADGDAKGIERGGDAQLAQLALAGLGRALHEAPSIRS